MKHFDSALTQPEKAHLCCDNCSVGCRCGMTDCGTVLCKSNASEFRRISWLFMAFRRNFPSKEISTTFLRTFKAPIVLFLPKFRTIIHSGLTNPEIARESSLFSIVSCEISEENSLWLLSILIQTKRNAATVRDLLLCKEL